MLIKQVLQSLFLLFFCATLLFAQDKNSHVKSDKALLTIKPSKVVAVYTEDKPVLVVDRDHAEFIIKLKSNPTTGYAWFLREYDKNLITPIKHHYENSDQKLLGAPSYEFWTFKVNSSGFVVPQQTIMRFVYTRPWQGTDGSTQLVFRISTRDAGQVNYKKN